MSMNLLKVELYKLKQISYIKHLEYTIKYQLYVSMDIILTYAFFNCVFESMICLFIRVVTQFSL